MKKVFPKVNPALGTGVLVAAVVAVERDYSNHPKDPGGETNHGITQAVAWENGDLGSIPNRWSACNILI